MTLRIIGGELKGKKLFSIPGTRARPTANRVRESIFNILANKIHRATVLDLYAGTGAMGIEALSRGATYVLFADIDKKTLAVLEKNINACFLEKRANVIKWNILKNLNIIRTFKLAFSLVFIDPPYNQNMIQPTLSNLAESQCLQKGTCVTIEHSLSEPISEEQSAFKIYDQRRYGKTLVSFLNYMV